MKVPCYLFFLLLFQHITQCHPVVVKSVVLTFGGNSGGTACTFPFSFNQKQFIECTSIDHDKPWCATTDNFDRDNKWGNCGRAIPMTQSELVVKNAAIGLYKTSKDLTATTTTYGFSFSSQVTTTTAAVVVLDSTTITSPSTETSAKTITPTTKLKVVTTKAVRCPLLTPPQGGSIDPVGQTSVGTRVTFSCGLGHAIRGQQQTTCLKNGRWDVTALPSCETGEACEELLPPDNGYLAPLDTSIGVIVSFFCHPGYRVVGSKKIRCKSNSQWNGTVPECEESGCEEIDPPRDGFFFPTNTTAIGATVTFGCAPEFSLVGTSALTCLPSRLWSYPIPYCEDVEPCEKLETPRHGSMTPSGRSHRNVGTTVRFSCQAGYLLKGKAEIKCTSESRWTGNVPMCEYQLWKVHKPQAGIYGGTFKWFRSESKCLKLCEDNNGCLGIDYNSFWKTCYHHYQKTVCKPSRQSKHVTHYKKKICPGTDRCDALQPPENGALWPPNTFHIGAVVTYQCYKGYVAVGETRLTCQKNGVWSSLPPLCEEAEPCEAMEPEAGVIVHPQGDVVFYAGNKVSFTCADRNNVLMGSRSASCQFNGLWSTQPPNCQFKGCEGFEAPLNGALSPVMESVPVGTVITFTCNSGFRVEGARQLKCQDNMAWSGAAPLCVEGSETNASPYHPDAGATIHQGEGGAAEGNETAAEGAEGEEGAEGGEGGEGAGEGGEEGQSTITSDPSVGGHRLTNGVTHVTILSNGTVLGMPSQGIDDDAPLYVTFQNGPAPKTTEKLRQEAVTEYWNLIYWLITIGQVTETTTSDERLAIWNNFYQDWYKKEKAKQEAAVKNQLTRYYQEAEEFLQEHAGMHLGIG